jgi:cytochrome c oxidase subunit 2
MQKKLAYFITATALMLALTACGGGNSSKDSEASSSASAPASASQEVVIKAKSWEFDQQEYAIPKDTPIKLTLENLNGAHGVEIVGTDYTLRGNKSTTIILAAGTYEIKCNIMCGKGHAGMKAKLVVS